RPVGGARSRRAAFGRGWRGGRRAGTAGGGAGVLHAGQGSESEAQYARENSGGFRTTIREGFGMSSLARKAESGWTARRGPRPKVAPVSAAMLDRLREAGGRAAARALGVPKTAAR